ncbi:MAG: T9SS type A sorting domain-containing protein [Saprospiraceae bacterium]
MKKTLTLFVFLIGVVVWGYGQSPATYNSSGTFTVPAGVTSLTAECWGGGGGGRNGIGGEGGGGGGAYARSLINSPNASYTVTVGAGGGPGTAGGNSSFGTAVIALGGGSGTGDTGAPGGSGVGSTGDVKFSGGNGGDAYNNFFGTLTRGGGGGGSAFSNSNGGNGGQPAGGLGFGNGGKGGEGLNQGGTAAENGFEPGGGGGGRSTLFPTAGSGAAGRVIITWTCPTYSITTTTVTTSPNPGNGNVAAVQTTGLPAGTYTVSYTFSTGVSPSSGSSSMTVNGSGVGTFNTVAVSGYTQTSTITITNLSSGTAPGICSNTVSSSAALPVTWLSFRAALDGDDVQLVWSTASESNNEGFDVQRSENGREWQTIAFVPGAGTTSEVQTYSYTDTPHSTLHTPLIYYRLQQRDYDGTTDYSPVRVIQLEAENAIRVFPNPADEAVTVAFAEPIEKRGTIQLFNHNGRLVAEEVIAPGTSEHTLRVAYLPAGNYMLRVVAGVQVWTKRVIVE